MAWLVFFLNSYVMKISAKESVDNLAKDKVAENRVSINNGLWTSLLNTRCT
jgi:hypothetical protein